MIKIGDRVRVEYSGKELAEYPYAKKLHAFNPYSYECLKSEDDDDDDEQEVSE